MFPFPNPTETKLWQDLRSVLSQCLFRFMKMTTGVFCTPREDEVGKALHEPAPFLFESGDIQLPLLNPECTTDYISRAAQPLFLFRDIITIRACVTIFCCISSKKTSKFPQAAWKSTPFFTPSATPQTAVLGLLQSGLRCLGRNLWDFRLQYRLFQTVILTALILMLQRLMHTSMLGLKHCIPGFMGTQESMC